MQFQVPQFIEVEDKIFGPLTFKQFIYVGGGVGAAYMLWRVLPSVAAVPLIIAVGGLAGALAFLQFNGRPFIQGVESAFFFFARSKLYLWNNRRKRVQRAVPLKPDAAAQIYVPKLSESRLHELAWSLDIKERIAAGIASGSERGESSVPGVVAPIQTARAALAR